MKNQDIRALRKRLGLSQREFAKRLGVSTRSVKRWEKGDTFPKSVTSQMCSKKMCGDTFEKGDTSEGDTSKSDTSVDTKTGANAATGFGRVRKSTPSGMRGKIPCDHEREKV